MYVARVFAAAALLLPFAAPVAGQEKPDTTTYEGARFPAWVAVEDVENDAGVHKVYVEVAWDDARSTLPFSQAVGAGELVVLIPTTDDADESDLSNGCRFMSRRMEHGDGRHATDRADADCTGPVAANLPLIGIEYANSEASMACTPATRTDGTEDAAIRYFGCYWSAPPGAAS